MTGDAAPLELRDVTSGYGDVPVIRRASMTFRERLITTIVGSNGAGKSTAVKVAAGLLRAWQGSVLTLGIDITREPADRRVYRGIGYVPQGRIVVPEMTVRDNLLIGAHILGNDRRAIEAAMERVLQLFPALKIAHEAARRHDERRRAADARDRPRADDEPKGHYAG